MNTAPPGPAQPAPYWNPYVAGVGLGLTLLLAFVTLGAGLGASGAITRASASVAHTIAPDTVESNGYLGRWFGEGSPMAHYLVFMAGGVMIGGFLSARSARRARLVVERGPRASVPLRLVLALAGGLLVGFASRLASGCTSGQALTGGALLLNGSWAFTFSMFASAFGAAWFVRREWL